VEATGSHRSVLRSVQRQLMSPGAHKPSCLHFPPTFSRLHLSQACPWSSLIASSRTPSADAPTSQHLSKSNTAFFVHVTAPSDPMNKSEFVGLKIGGCGPRQSYEHRFVSHQYHRLSLCRPSRLPVLGPSGLSVCYFAKSPTYTVPAALSPRNRSPSLSSEFQLPGLPLFGS
jgi:hypothetical protein